MSDFFERKIRTLFARFDVDGSGSIEEEDFDKWADKLVSYGRKHKYLFVFLFRDGRLVKQANTNTKVQITALKTS